MLTDRQQLTVEHLNYSGEKTPQQIIDWAKNNLKRPRRDTKRKEFHHGRKHSKKYYEQIIAHFEELL